MARVLVVDDSLVQAKHLEYLLVAVGHAVEVTTNGFRALEAVRRSVPEVVVSDIKMPEMSGLELVAALRGEFPGLPVVVCSGEGTEELAVEALRTGAASYVPKRNLIRDLVPVLDDVLSVASSQKKQLQLLDRMTMSEDQFSLENDPDLIPQVVGHVETVLRYMALFDTAEHMRIGVAVHEAVINAMIHGNLEISSDLKTGNWQAYYDAIAARARQEPYRQRRVSVTVRAARGPYLEVRVLDQGRGFDPTSLPDPSEPENMAKASGRGLLLIRTFFDRVTHSPTGNEIIMAKGLG